MFCDNIVKRITSISKQRGGYLLGMSIAMLAGTIISIGSAKVAISNMNASKGQTIGNQLQIVNGAVSAYIASNSNTLISGGAITGISKPLEPTVTELKNLGFLATNVSTTPIYGTSYNINIVITPAGCTSNCQIEGKTWLSDPIRATGGQSSDVRLLTSALKASSTRQIGFSTPSTTGTISGPGWTTSNPDPLQRAGILLATTNFNTSTNAQYWLKSVLNIADLPASGNNIGDGRLTQDTGKPYMWTGTTWQELFGYKSPGGFASTSIGANSGLITRGQENVFIGPSAGSANINSYQNTLVGKDAGLSMSVGGNNAFFGYSAGRAVSNGSSNAFFGSHAGSSSQYDGGWNTYLGSAAGSWAKGSNNTYIGAAAGPQSGGGSNNIAIGISSLGANIAATSTLQGNIAIGNRAQAQSNSGGNISVGHDSLFKLNSGSMNIAIGGGALFQATQSVANIAIGEGAMVATTSGYFSTAVGHNSLYRNISGEQNAAFGGGALGLNSTGSFNLAAGRDAGRQNTTGNYNVMLGYNAGPASSGLTNTITIGANTSVSTSNTAVIGNSSIAQIGGAVAWSNLSDRRLKSDITTSERGLDFIKKLRPVDYVLTGNGKRETGFIAQEVEEVDPKFEGINKPISDKDFYSLTYTDFIPSIVKSIQQLDQKIGGQQTSTRKTQNTNAIIGALGLITLLFVGISTYLYRRINALEERLRILELVNA